MRCEQRCSGAESSGVTKVADVPSKVSARDIGFPKCCCISEQSPSTMSYYPHSITNGPFWRHARHFSRTAAHKALSSIHCNTSGSPCINNAFSTLITLALRSRHVATTHFFVEGTPSPAARNATDTSTGDSPVYNEPGGVSRGLLQQLKS
jgi:hypothetical protein